MESPSYRALADGFRWQVPERFNFAIDVVERWAAKGDGPCLLWEDEAGRTATHTFSGMARLAARFGEGLRRQGVRKGDRVILILPRIPQWQVAMTGAMRIGAVPIPCIEMLTGRDVAYRVADAEPAALVCRGSEAPRYREAAASVPTRIALGGADGFLDWDELMEAAPEDGPAAIVEAEDPAVMYYTSGSTGHPKGVLHAARAIWAWRMSARYWLDLSPGDRIWCTADTGWSKAGTSILFGPWSEGACAFFHHGGFDPKRRLALLEKHAITVYCAPATELNRVVQEDVAAHDLSALRCTVSAGEAMNPAVAARWREATGVEVAEAYGQTEALMVALNIAGEPVKPGSMGLAAPGCTLAVVDEDGRRLPDGQEGRIALAAPNPQLMLGYWRAAERTAERFVDGPDGRFYLTGDRGVRDRDGYFWYRGRDDDVINSAGYRIGPLEVENAILEHPDVAECAVVAAPDPGRGEVVKACVVLRPGAAPSDDLARAIKDHVKTVTAPYKYPRIVEFREDLPRTLTGKIMRRALRDEARSDAARDGR